MLTPIPFTKRIKEGDDRARLYVDEMNEAVLRCRDRGEQTLGGVIDFQPETDAGAMPRRLVYPAFTLLDEEPAPLLEYPAALCRPTSVPAVSTYEEQLHDLACRRVAEAA